ncbi:MAG: hypothetical protein RI531_04640 [Haloferacaceae archaeon]|nr:hypothetical protein [Haloferacaceae archaeon]
MAVAACHDCEQVIGPMLAQDVGNKLFNDHLDHDTELVATWTTVEILEFMFFD